MLEIELKFQIPTAQRARLRAALRRRKGVSTSLAARYFDTPDSLLARHAVALRLRREGQVWVQTLKASAAVGAVRHEHNVVLTDLGEAPPTLQPQRHQGSPAYEALCAALEPARFGALHEVYRTEVQRQVVVLKAPGGCEVELAFDEGSVATGTAVYALCEIEFELKRGPVAGLFTLAGQWAERHGLWLDTVSKAERGHLLSRGLAHPAPVKAAAPVVGRRSAPGALARACVRACLAQVLPNASAVAAGSADPEHGHQLRVGLRRLRTAIAELAGLDPTLDPAWNGPLARVFRALGQQRDGQVLSRVWPEGAPMPPPAPLPRADAGAVDVAAQVASPDFQGVLIAVLGWVVDETPDTAAAPMDDAMQALEQRLERLQRPLRRGAKAFETLDAPQRHRLRKRLKRLRYLSEFMAPLYGARRVARYLDKLTAAQDALGQLTDEVVALDETRRRLTEQPDEAALWFALGWLDARQPQLQRLAARALKRAGQARAFWQG